MVSGSLELDKDEFGKSVEVLNNQDVIALQFNHLSRAPSDELLVEDLSSSTILVAQLLLERCEVYPGQLPIAERNHIIQQQLNFLARIDN